MEPFSKRLYSWIILPEREAETVWVAGSPFNRVDVERGVFQRENMDYLTGEYEASMAMLRKPLSGSVWNV
jgi:phenylacetate-coenzyme A ligase PaaK-like adenylate-forming protein